MSPRRKLLKIIAVTLGCLVLMVGGVLLAFRIVLARAPEYRQQVQQWVSERTALDIQFSHMDVRWRFYGPELVFDSAVVRSRDGKRMLVSAQRVSLGFDVWSALRSWRLVAGRLTLERPQLQIIRTADGRFEVVGQSELPARDPNIPFEPDAIPTGRLQVVDARVTFRDLKTGRGPWVVPGVSFDLKRSGRAMHLQGQAELPSDLGKSLQFVADTQGRLAEAEDLRWQFNIAARALNLAGWAEIGPKDFPAPRSGNGSFVLAGVFQGANVSELSAQVQFNEVSLVLPGWRIPIPEIAKLEPYVDRDDDAPLSEGASKTVSAELVAAPEKIVLLPQMPAASTALHYQRIAFEMQLNHSRDDHGEDWHARIKKLELTRAKATPNSLWRPSSLSVDMSQSIGGALNVNVQADLLVLENIWPLLAYGNESETLARIRALHASGRISELKADFARAAKQAAPTYSIKGRITDLSIDAIDKAPGVSNISAVLDGDQSSGRIDLNVRNGALDLPRYFRTSLPVERVAGTLHWLHDVAGWRLATDDIQVETVDGNAHASGEVFIPPNGASPEVNVHAIGTNLVARAAPRYLPANKLSPKALEWLDRAFPSGAVPHAEFEMRGPVRSFPFRNNEGLFLIKAHIAGLTLDYQPEWIAATDLSIDAEFRNEGMSATVLSGNVNDLHIASASGSIADFKNGELLLNAAVDGDLSQALSYLQKTPVGPAIGAQFMALGGHGKLHGEMQLRLPFKDVEQRKLNVMTKIANATVTSKSLPQTVTELNGTLKVQDFALQAVDLQGKLLGGQVSIKGGVEGHYTGRGAGLQITAQGRAIATQLHQALHLPTSIALGGALQWQLVAHSPRHAAETPAVPTFSLDSDTRGLSLSLPEPLGKVAESARPLHIDVDASQDDQILVRGAFGDARTLLRVTRDKDIWHLDRGGIRVDGIAAALPGHTGLRIEGSIDRLVLDDWLKLKGDGSGSSRLSDYLRGANVRIGHFGFLGYSWSDTRAILQANDNAWRVDAAGPDITGQLTIPYDLDSSPLQLALAKLNIGEHVGQSTVGQGSDDQSTTRNSATAGTDGKDNAKLSSRDPHDVPGIVARVDELSWGGRRLGAARVTLEKTPQGVQMTSGELRGDTFALTAHGSWLATDAKDSLASLDLGVTSSDVLATLRVFNFHDVITAKHASAHASLSWGGGIDEDLLSRASGKVHLEVSNGQLLNIDPGAGRVLGLLSFAALPRRLSLNFSDVTDKGFSFDTIHGDFELQNGDALTNNLLMHGPAAEIGMVGRAGLTKHDYDQTVVVAGDIGGSLSVASAVVGGPVLGAAVLAFTRLFKEPLKGVARRYYHITGSWDNPVVDRIDAQEAKQNSVETNTEVKDSNQSAQQSTPDENSTKTVSPEVVSPKTTSPETKPPETKPSETKPSETKPSETLPSVPAATLPQSQN